MTDCLNTIQTLTKRLATHFEKLQSGQARFRPPAWVMDVTDPTFQVRGYSIAEIPRKRFLGIPFDQKPVPLVFMTCNGNIAVYEFSILGIVRDEIGRMGLNARVEFERRPA